MANAKMYVSEVVAKRRSAQIVKESWQIMSTYLRTNKADGLLKKLGSEPVLTWKKMGFGACGRTWTTGAVEMNTNYLYSKDAKEFIEGTTRHELAHLICYRLFKELKHNARFKTVARMLGDDGERCANYAEPSNKPARKRIYIKCACGHVHELTAAAYEKTLTGYYRCAICKRNLCEAKIVSVNK